MTVNFNTELTCAVAVRDLDRSVGWYTSVLGFAPLYRMDDIGWCELSTHLPGITVGLSVTEGGGESGGGGGGGATLTFGVTDIEAAQRSLDALGIRQDGPIQTIEGMVRLLTFFDPDDNALMFAESLLTPAG